MPAFLTQPLFANIYLASVISLSPAFRIFAHIFLILNAMAKKAKSIVTLSSPTCRNLLYAILYFICPKTASGSMHRLPLCLTPSSESNLSRTCRLYWFNRWLTSIIRFPCALKQLPRKGHPPHLCALYRTLSVMYPLAVLSRLSDGATYEPHRNQT